jgi:cytochrome c-type biogenesis protein CcmH/NrfG
VAGATPSTFVAQPIDVEEQITNTLIAHGFDAAETQLRSALASAGDQAVRFKVMNRIGYEFLYTNRPALAVSAFRLNVIAHPSLSSAFESLGEGYEAESDRADAIAAFSKALQLDPKNADAVKELQKVESPAP